MGVGVTVWGLTSTAMALSLPEWSLQLLLTFSAAVMGVSLLGCYGAMKAEECEEEGKCNVVLWIVSPPRAPLLCGQCARAHAHAPTVWRR